MNVASPSRKTHDVSISAGWGLTDCLVVTRPVIKLTDLQLV